MTKQQQSKLMAIKPLVKWSEVASRMGMLQTLFCQKLNGKYKAHFTDEEMGKLAQVLNDLADEIHKVAQDL